MENEFRIITPIPDDNTCEAMVYGSQYKFAKSSTFFWDRLEEMLKEEIETLKGQLIDPVFCSHVLNSPGQRRMIFRKSPPVSNPDQIKDLWTLRRISYLGAALENLETMREQNLMWATMQGVKEQVGRMMDAGISDSQWKAAMDGIDMPIEYSTVRRILDRERHFADKEVIEIEQSMEERRQESERFERDLENYRRMNHDEDYEDEEDEDGLPEIKVYKEVEDCEKITENPVSSLTEDPESPVLVLLKDMIRPSMEDDLDSMIAICEHACRGVING